MRWKCPNKYKGDPWMALRFAIIRQAVIDYSLAKNCGGESQPTVQEVEHFFRSEWGDLVTGGDGKLFLKILEKRWKTIVPHVKRKFQPIRIVETGQVFPSIVACEEYIGASHAAINMFFRGKARAVKGYTFERVKKNV